MLLEALVAILVFSLGVLSLVGLQAASMRQSIQAKYRADAALLADQLVGEMWVSNRSFTALKANFETGGTNFNTWNTTVSNRLPGAAATASVASQADGSGGLTSLVTITIQWKAPNEPATQASHAYTAVTQIR